MRNTIIYDRVILFKQKFEEHFLEEFDILPAHFRQIQDLAEIPLDKIAERLDYMMRDDQFFSGNISACTIPAFVRNFNRFRPSNRKEELEKKKREEELFYICPDCGKKEKRVNKASHIYNCSKYLQERTHQ